MKKTTALALTVVTALFAGQALAEHHEGKGHKRHNLFEKADTNKDGTVTKAEFLAQSEKMFGKLDTNGDGKITKAEHDEHRAKFAEKRKEWKAKRDAAKKAE